MPGTTCSLRDSCLDDFPYERGGGPRIFALSARQGLNARLVGDRDGLLRSRIYRLEQAGTRRPALTIGKWLVTASTMSWCFGSITSTLAPSRCQKSVRPATWALAAPSCGVRMHQRFRNRVEKPASGPLFSVPATGWAGRGTGTPHGCTRSCTGRWSSPPARYPGHPRPCRPTASALPAAGSR